MGVRATPRQVREAFGNLSNVALASLAGASRAQIKRIEQFIIAECYVFPTPQKPVKEIAKKVDK